MKIVKMHKGSREAFDDFLAQRLNEVEVDNDMADQYFADMNLPIPVMPDTKISFLHKNKLWLLLLLCMASISTYVIVNNKNIKLHETNTAKNKYLLDNAVVERNSNIIRNENTISKKENKSIPANSIRIGSVGSFLHTKEAPKTETMGSNTLSNNKSVKVKISNIKISNYLDTATIVDKANSIAMPIIPKKALQIEKKIANADSLYIIW
jgi:hypothetical protein